MQKILVANRGEIAARIMRTAGRMGIETLAVFSAADKDADHVLAADEAQYLGAAPIQESYCNIDAVMAAAQNNSATAVHPGYGFLSENVQFARRVMDAGLTWIGPPLAAMEAMSSKIRAREIAIEHSVPVIPARAVATQLDAEELNVIGDIGFPLLLKASAGGGGIGMREVHRREDLALALSEARAQAERQFGSGALLAERLVTEARHIEVQIVADQHGNQIHLYDRDCSIQRRRQKIIEEAPAPNIADELRTRLHQAALRLAAAVGYEGVGTVEFLVKGDEFFLLEMNTRLQVEHGVSEEICGLDLVQLQIEIVNGLPLSVTQQDVSCTGHAIEARLYAEDPEANFAPAAGTVLAFDQPDIEGIRIDTGVSAGSAVGHHYDGLLCKIIAHGKSREEATARLCRALMKLSLVGVNTNQRLLLGLLNAPEWQLVQQTTSLLEANLQRFLNAAQLSTSLYQRCLAAATIWQFRCYPPAADVVPWPGAYQFQRNTQWRLSSQVEDVAWRWRAADCYEFVDYQLTVVERDGSRPSEGFLCVEMAGSPHHFQFFVQNTGIWLWSTQTGAVYLAPVYSSYSAELADTGGSCQTPGPGQILKLLAGVGDLVNEGDDLVVIESMKMESTFKANIAGEVSGVHVVDGELVESGQLLMTITARSDGQAIQEHEA
jgi:acetyl/propionyl-CoA carboxylase alpha subunit